MGALQRVAELLDVVGEQVVAVLDLHQLLLELARHVVEALRQPADLVGAHDGQAHGQVTLGRLLGCQSDGHDGHGQLAGQPPDHHRSQCQCEAQHREQQPWSGHSATRGRCGDDQAGVPGAGGCDLERAAGQTCSTSTQPRQRERPQLPVTRTRGGRSRLAIGAGNGEVDVRRDPDVLEPAAQLTAVQRQGGHGRHRRRRGPAASGKKHRHSDGVRQERRERRGCRDNPGRTACDRGRTPFARGHIQGDPGRHRWGLRQHDPAAHDRPVARSALQSTVQRCLCRLALGRSQRHQAGRVAGTDARLHLQGGDRTCNVPQPRGTLFADPVGDRDRKDNRGADQQGQQYDTEDERQTDSHRQRVQPPDVLRRW